jgi:hypothetical protein
MRRSCAMQHIHMLQRLFAPLGNATESRGESRDGGAAEWRNRETSNSVGRPHKHQAWKGYWAQMNVYTKATILVS